VKRIIIFAALMFVSYAAFGQNVRWDLPVTTVQASGGNLLPVYAIPGAGVQFFSCSGSTCNTLATTYISATSSTACPNSPIPMQVVLNGTSTCVSSADPYGNMGGWFLPGQYMATITIGSANYNYYFTIGTASNVSGPVVNLLQYAKCDGATDDRVAIGSAFAAAGTLAASTGSAYIYMPDGLVCLINSNPNSAVSYNSLVTLPPGVGIKGSGAIKIGNGVNFDSLYAWTSTPTPATFEDFTVDLNGANNPITTDPNLGTINRRAVFQTYVTGGNGLYFHNITFKNGNGVWTIATAANNVTIDGNHWQNWGLNSSVNFDASLIYSNPVFGTTVTNNDFTQGGPALRTAIEVHNNDAVIKGNRVYGFPIGIVYAANPAVTGTTVSRANIIGNTLYDSVNCILLGPQNGPIDNASVLGNTCLMDRQNIATNYVFNGTEQGIGWYFNYGLSNFKIDNNTVEWVTETSSQPVAVQMAGISLYNGTLGANATLVNGEVAGNTVTNSPYACFNFFPTSINTLLVRNNFAINCTATSVSLPSGAFGGGFAWQLGTGGTVKGLIVENNHASDTRATTKLQTGFQWTGVASDGAPTGASFTNGNTVAYAGTPNAYFNFYNSGPLINLIVPGGPTGGYINFVSMTSGNYTPLGSVVYDPTSLNTWTNGASNNLVWLQSYLPALSNGNGAVISGALMNSLTGSTQVNSGTKFVFAPAIPGAGADLMTGPASGTSGDCVKQGDGVFTLADAGGSCLFTSVQASVTSSNVTMTTAGTYYDGPTTSSQAAGTWLITGTVSLQTSATPTAAINFTCKLWDGSTVFSSTGDYIEVTAVGATKDISLTLSAVATEASAATFKISCTSDTNGQFILYQTAYGSVANASSISAVRIK
jgi:hypothetical protein